MNDIPKHQLLPGFNRREAKAIDFIYTKYQPAIFTLVERLIGQGSTVADFVADIFLQLLEHPNPFESIRGVREFLYQAARNVCFDHLRHQRVVDNRLNDVQAHYQQLDDREMEKASIIAASHQLMRLAIDTLTGQCRQVFLLCYRDQLKNAEIARRLRISAKTVANHKLTAHRLLRKQVAAAGGKRGMGLLSILLF